MENIKGAVHNIRKRIENAALRIGRNLSEITILAASKTRKPEEITLALNSGITVFGENYVQEFLQKYEDLKDYRSISWHFIGHLQKNKARFITGMVELIHSIDSVDLCALIDRNSSLLNAKTKVLIEVNLANEPAKNGIKADEVFGFISKLNPFNFLSLKGLMTMPPLANTPEENRRYFRELKDLLFAINKKNTYKEELKTLSMGTSGDFEVAIEEGSTIVRLGTAIFGERPGKAKNQ